MPPKPRLGPAVPACVDATIRSPLLGTHEVVPPHHHDRGMRAVTGTEFARRLEERTGIRPGRAAETFTDPAQNVRPCGARLRLPYTGAVRGCVLDEAA
ncbi:hypothetical protein ACGFMK_43120 [Amycolatopsis sp. NPDC049252]|uniref:hypothetical protein n=1 Tax=Amycolatopsis sp. NPDC049252 TaxID=3363933 RepID=UPI003717EA87